MTRAMLLPRKLPFMSSAYPRPTRFNNTALPIASTAGGVDSYTLYGRITGGGNSVTVVPGTYTDTINVSVTY